MTNSTRPKENLRGGKGNFANDPQRASEAGKKGGHNSHLRSDSHDRHAASGSNSHARKSMASEDANEDNEEEGM